MPVRRTYSARDDIWHLPMEKTGFADLFAIARAMGLSKRNLKHWVRQLRPEWIPSKVHGAPGEGGRALVLFRVE